MPEAEAVKIPFFANTTKYRQKDLVYKVLTSPKLPQNTPCPPYGGHLDFEVKMSHFVGPELKVKFAHKIRQIDFDAATDLIVQKISQALLKIGKTMDV